MKPLCVDLYCGLGGWSSGFLAEGYDCIGYDIEAHDYGTGSYPGQLVLRDILTVHGSEFKDATVIVGSSPCQKYSYMAMPWSKAKDMAKWYRDKDHPERIVELNALFDAQFRIQREASDAAGRYIPMIVENVKGAQPWVGKAKANFGSFYLWGDVGMVGRRVVVVSEGRILGGRGVMPTTKAVKHDGSGWLANGTLRSSNRMVVSGHKVPSIPTHPREDFGWNHSQELQDGRKVGGIELSKVGFNVSAVRKMLHGDPNVTNADGRKTQGHVNKRDGHSHTRHLTNQWESDAVKQPGLSGPRENGKPRDKMLGDKGPAAYGSKSNQRKMASAMIAKIPLALAQHVARSCLTLHDERAALRVGGGKS